MLDDVTTLADLRARFPRSGRVTCIGLRPAPRAAIRVVDSAHLTADAGIEGDHRATRGGGKRRPLSFSRNISAPSPRWRGSTPSIPRC